MALNINGTTGISGVDGSASAPALQGTDSNTGVSFGTDTVNITTGGTTRATIDSSGSLDVPTTFPIKVNGSEKLRIDSSGKVGIGTTSPVTQFHSEGSGDQNIRLSSSTHNTFLQMGVASGETFHEYKTLYRLVDTDNGERMRIDSSGHVYIGNTSFSSGLKVKQFEINSNAIATKSSASATGLQFHNEFHNSNGLVGSISTNGSSTTFSTSSDYRLKENVVSISDGITRLKTLKPSRFNFKVDKDTTVDGFLAHEVTAVPEAITGTKDEVDSDNKPIYQGIDQSKLVPLLTAALQEAVAKIEVLETKVAALEAA